MSSLTLDTFLYLLKSMIFIPIFETSVSTPKQPNIIIIGALVFLHIS